MRNNEKNQQAQAVPQRPLASAAEIRAMNDKAAAHQLAADQQEAQALHDTAGAKRMADDMVENARAEANRIVRHAQEQAAALERQAEENAKKLRAVKADEETRARFWASLAAEEAVRAGLPAEPQQAEVPETGPFDPLASALVTRHDQLPPVEQDGSQP